MTTLRHQPVVFEYGNAELIGVIEHAPEPRDTGVIIVTGGPQYRVGSHRQFVDIARQFALAGYTTMRFDYRGMGDSSGTDISFFETAPDLRAAIDTLMANADVRQVVLWGLCDAASAAMIYAHEDDRVRGLVLLNPWVRTDEGLAQAYVKNYYVGRLLTRDFWHKLTTGQFMWRKSIMGLYRNVAATLLLLVRPRRLAKPAYDGAPSDDFRERMRVGLEIFRGNTLFLLCGNDLTASEFIDFTKQSGSWRDPMAKETVKQKVLPDMDHTFSTYSWRKEIVAYTLEWLSSQVETG